MGVNNSKNENASSADESTSSMARRPDSLCISVYSSARVSHIGGVYHSGVELFDTEYMYGSGSSSLSGISSMRPRSLTDPQWRFSQTIVIGHTNRSREEVRGIIAEMKQNQEWAGNAYSITGHNCNHFSEAVCTRLGLTFPSWLNRGAKLLHAVGLGTNATGVSAVDHDGRPLRDADRASLIIEPIVDVCVDSMLDAKRVGMIGGKANRSVLISIIPIDATGARTQLNPAAYVQSDADEQLLLFLPFTRPVKLLSFLIRLSTLDGGATNPHTIRLFANNPNVSDFADAESTTATLEVSLPAQPVPARAFTQKETRECVFEHVVTLPIVKFAAVTCCTMFVVDNHGAAQTKINGLTFVGRDK